MRKALVRFFTADRPVAIVILLNALVLFVLSFDEMQPYHLWLEILDGIFLTYFMVEALIKIQQSGWKEYIYDGWNRFDFIIVLFSIPSLVFFIYPTILSSNLSVIFVLRIIRVARFIKFFRFIPNLDELIAGIRRAFKASVFVLVAFVVYGFIISLVSCRLFKGYAPDLFGDPVNAFYNIFKVFTIEGWFEVPEKMLNEYAFGYWETFLIKLYFIMIVVTGGLFGLSIVNAIFVEEMVRDNNDELESKMDKLDEKMNLVLQKLSESSLEPTESPTGIPPLSEADEPNDN